VQPNLIPEGSQLFRSVHDSNITHVSNLEGDPLVHIGVAGALAREMQQDHEAFVEFLANALARAFPSLAQLKYEGGFLSKKRICGVTIELGENTYGITKAKHSPLEATRVHTVRGIALKTEVLPVEEWLAEISAEIETRVQKDSSSRTALASALGLE